MANKVQLLDNRWDDQKAATLDEPGKLLYRSNLLGADKRITNYGGGNTSAKVTQTDRSCGGRTDVFGDFSADPGLEMLHLLGWLAVFRRNQPIGDI